MTKDQLRDALIEVGVKTQVKAKKADLVKLYREHVLNEKVCRNRREKLRGELRAFGTLEEKFSLTNRRFHHHHNELLSKLVIFVFLLGLFFFERIAQSRSLNGSFLPLLGRRRHPERLADRRLQLR